MDDNSNLTISTLFNNSDEKKIENFEKRTKSDLVVDLHFDKVEANFDWLDIMEIQ